MSPFIPRERLDTLETAEEELRKIQTTYQGVVDRANTLQRQVDATEHIRLAGEVTPEAIAAVEGLMASGKIRISAREAALAAVRETYREQAVNALTPKIIEEHGKAFYARIAHQEGPQIRADLEAQFAEDGTFAGVEEEQRTALYEEVKLGLLDDARKALEDPEAQARLAKQAREELSTDPQHARDKEAVEVDAYQQVKERIAAEQLDEHRSVLDADADGSLRSQIEAELAASKSHQKALAKLRADVKQAAKERTTEEILEETKHAALQQALNERADILAQQVETENHKAALEALDKKLVGDFENLGIDTNQVARGSKLVLYLGGSIAPVEVTRQKEEEYYEYGHRRTRKVDYKDTQQELHYHRQITVISLGDGRFELRQDSLADSSNPYEKESAIAQGSIIRIGRPVSDNGANRLEQMLTRDTTFCYDDTEETPEFHSAVESVTAIELDGIKSYDVANVKKTKR